MEIAWIMGGFFLFCLMAFLVIALFLPEWVGITGKKAKDVISHQQGKHQDDPQKDLL